MKRTIATVCGFVLVAYAGSAQSPGATQWTDAQLKSFAASLVQKMDASKSASQPLADLGTYSIQISHREANGQAEVHERVNDVFVVRSGEATLVTGGKLVDPKTTAEGELRASSVAGGQPKPLGAGDIVSIPAGTPHQLLLKGGTSITYLVIKVKAR